MCVCVCWCVMVCDGVSVCTRCGEQTQRGHWNKGVLFNRGVKYAESIGCDYVVMNDVDQLPVNDKILHEWPKVSPASIGRPKRRACRRVTHLTSKKALFSRRLVDTVPDAARLAPRASCLVSYFQEPIHLCTSTDQPGFTFYDAMVGGLKCTRLSLSAQTAFSCR